MKARDWNNGLNHIDPDLVEEFINTGTRLELRRKRKKRGMLWLRIGAIAACLAILVASPFALIPLLHPQDPTVPPTSETEKENATENTDNPSSPPSFLPLLERVQTPSGAPFYYGSENSIGSSSENGAHSVDGISVTARYIETLPDTYLFFDSWNQVEFGILRMETVKQLNGSNMVDEFYYMVPVEYMTDFSLYDCFVLGDMGQYSTNVFSVLYNVTDGCAETMDLILFGYRAMPDFSDHLSGYDMMAFDETGTIDLRLWQSTEAWQENSAGAMERYGATYTLAQAEETESSRSRYYVYTQRNLSDAAIKELTDLASFKNGIFVPFRSSSGRFLGHGTNYQHHDYSEFYYRHYINGFATNEWIRISTADVSEDGSAVTKRSTAQFTDEDAARLPDLASAAASVTAALEAGQITPPHIQDLSTKKLSEWSGLGVFAWYAKTDDGVIGIIRINWKYKNADIWELPATYFDDAYYVIEYGSDTAIAIDRDALLERIGKYESTFIFDGDYNENGKDPDSMNIVYY